MKVVLVGPPAVRARLRTQMNGSATVVGEFATLGAAQAARFDADAFVIAADSTSVAQGFLTSEALAQEVSPADDQELIETLTPREIQVLELLAEGRSNKAIGQQLGISDQTVKFHVAAIAGKLGAVNRTDAVRRAIRRGIVSV
jgi:DNA-binding NarL/FixJ family response regulator